MKDALRKEMRERLKKIEWKNVQSSLYLPVGIETLFVYLSHGSELDVSPVIEEAVHRGLTVAAPRIQGSPANRKMGFFSIESATGPFTAGTFGIREPAEGATPVYPATGERTVRFPVLILVPGLAFDRSGNRLGRGAGYYDRFLESFFASYPEKRDEITLAGVCYSFQIVDLVPAEPHDIPVDCLLTENGCILCTNT